MILQTWYDHNLDRFRVEATDVTPEENFSLELLDQADGERLIYDGQTITVNVDNGKWIWRVISFDRDYGTILGRWPD